MERCRGDKALLEKLILDGSIKGKNFYILEAMGKDNIVNVINILKVPNYKFLIIYDTDKKNNDEIENLKENDNIEILSMNPSLEEHLMSEEIFKEYDKKNKADNRTDLKPARLLQYFEEDKLIKDNLNQIIEKCNKFLSSEPVI